MSSFSDVFECFVLGDSVPGGRERGHLQGCIRHEFLVVLSAVSDLGKKKIFTTYTTAEGYCGVMERNLQNGKVRRINLAKFAVDDHNAGAVELLEDGRILYIVTGHSEKKYLEIFISKKSGDISHWKKRRLKTEGWVTYAQIVRTEKGYFLFTRERWNDKLENGKRNLTGVGW